MSTQLGKLFGVKLSGHNIFALLADYAARHIREHACPDAGHRPRASIIVLELLRRFAPKIPGALVVFILALIGSAVFNLQDAGVPVIGEVPRGLPLPRAPMISLDLDTDLMPAAVGIALLTFPEGVLLARAFAAKNHYPIRPNQELLALSAANVACRSFPGLLRRRQPVAQDRQRCDRWQDTDGQLHRRRDAGAVSGFLTGLLKLLPVVSLASILIFSGIHLVEIEAYRSLYKIRPRAFALAMVVTVGVLVVGVIPGILIGVMISLVVLLGQLARPTDAVLLEVPATGTFPRHWRHAGSEIRSRAHRLSFLRAAVFCQCGLLHASPQRTRRRQSGTGALGGGGFAGGDGH